MSDQQETLLFDVPTPLEFNVHCYQDYWERKVVAQHPVMNDRLEDVKRTLAQPIEIRLSNSDSSVYLFYSQDDKRLVCVVARRTNGEGFLITAYPTDAIKQGEMIWTK